MILVFHTIPAGRICVKHVNSVMGPIKGVTGMSRFPANVDGTGLLRSSKTKRPVPGDFRLIWDMWMEAIKAHYIMHVVFVVIDVSER